MSFDKFYFFYKENFSKIGRSKSYQFLPSKRKLLALKRKEISLKISRIILTKSTKENLIFLLYDSKSNQSSCSFAHLTRNITQCYYSLELYI